ncbi:hypothetical protein [Streptomyces mirabilis]|uniref:hypothetical protein n=1 Tax=Streptomyces mirabilis TaxID=68239 RepID=UPI0033E0E492
MTNGQTFTAHLRTILALTPGTPRFDNGHDQHRPIDRVIRVAHDNVSNEHADDRDERTAAGYNATLAWTMFIHNEKAPDSVLDHVQNLSPWDFCGFLGDLTDANPRTSKQQAEYFGEMADRLEAEGPTVWMIVSGQDYYPEEVEQVFVDNEALARSEFDKRTLSFAVKSTKHGDDGSIKHYNDASEYIALTCMSATVRATA